MRSEHRCAAAAILLVQVLCNGSLGETLVGRGTTWQYVKGTAEASEPRRAWREADFDDSAWSHGRAPLGYGGSGLNTTLADMQNSYSSFFLRRTFSVSGLDPDMRLRASVDYDDGFILWLNGERVWDKGEPDGDPLYNSLAAGYIGATGIYLTNELADLGDLLETGDNVMAVQVFNNSLGSGDCRFDLELSTFRRVADTTFSTDRGFHNAPFSLTVSTATPGATIRYTTNGARVTASSTPAPAPYTNLVLSIASTTCVRAAAFKSGYEPTNVDTHTYLFLAGVLQQAEMDPDVVNDPRYAGTIADDLRVIPSLCIAGNPAEVQSDAYFLQTQEFPISLELLHAEAGREGFAVNCGLRYGGWSDSVTNGWKGKPQYNVFFKPVYGPGKLDYPLFGEDYELTAFDNLRLRPEGNDCWNAWIEPEVVWRAQYARDEFGRRTQEAMGYVGVRGTRVHLYINGFYRGLYNPCEKPSETYMAGHFGGEADDYDVIKQGYQVVGGDLTAWNAMLSFAANNNLAADANYQAMFEHLDIPRFIDYNIIQIWGPNMDWSSPTRSVAGNNWRAGRKSRNRQPGDPQWQFFIWDYEVTMEMYPGCGLNTNIAMTGSTGNLHKYLKNNVDYVTQFGDHVYRSFYNGGALTPAACTTRYARVCDEIDRAIVGESARWGDGHPSHTTDPLTRDDDWLPMKNHLLADWFPYRTDIVLGQLRAQGLYPTLTPPAFQPHGGAIASGFRLTMSNANGSGQVYYTLDGSDPRVFGGGSRGQVSGSATGYTGPVTLSKTTHVKARVYKSATTWSAVHEATYNFTAHYSRIRITEILYNPLGGRDFEFVEIKNTGTSTRGLSDMTLKGVRYSFPPAVELEPGAFALLAANEAVFTNRYPGA
ncbi:MAG: chitobiase/beta-hexosaminidase C-terminal domain-containing protein, partial [Kiritimatiellae bacterium]|nr:chitobiase/beta-hexosaminidase C-terminal domain-containing protein [Kiritimatiellia bacterium]